MSRGEAVLEEFESTLSRLVESVKKIRTSEDWVDQYHSPLGKRKHLALVRSGELPGNKVDRLVLVRRGDLDAFIERHRVHVASAEEAATAQAELDDIVRGLAAAPKRRRRA